MNKRFFILIACVLIGVCAFSQVQEPEFIGEAYLLYADGTYSLLDKEFGVLLYPFQTTTLEVAGTKAYTRLPAGQPLQIVVRAANNYYDPMAVISICRLRTGIRTRSVIIRREREGSVMPSKTNIKDLVRFASAERYGKSSYLITIKDIPAGEYGIFSEYSTYEGADKVIVSCFAIDKK